MLLYLPVNSNGKIKNAINKKRHEPSEWSVPFFCFVDLCKVNYAYLIEYEEEHIETVEIGRAHV